MIWELFSYLYTGSSLGGQLASEAARPSPNFRVASIFGRFQKQTHTTTIVAVEETIGKRKQKSFSLSKTTSTLELLLLWWWKESSAWRKLMPSKVFPLFPLLLSLNSSFSNLNSAWAFEASVKYHIWPPKGKVIFQKFTFQRKMGANFSIGEEEGREGGGGWARKRKGGSKKTKKKVLSWFIALQQQHTQQPNLGQKKILAQYSGGRRSSILSRCPINFDLPFQFQNFLFIFLYSQRWNLNTFKSVLERSEIRTKKSQKNSYFGQNMALIDLSSNRNTRY